MLDQQCSLVSSRGVHLYWEQRYCTLGNTFLSVLYYAGAGIFTNLITHVLDILCAKKSDEYWT